MRRQDLLDLDDVLQHPGRKLAVDISTELPEETDVDLATPIDGFLEAVSTGNLLLIGGSFTTSIHADCARCAASLVTDLKFDLDEQFLVEGIPSSLSAQDYAKVVSDEPFPLFDGNALAVEDLIRQALFLSIPVQILCAHGWEGDCPVARAQLEERATESRTSPAFLALEAFRQEEDVN